MEHYLCGFVKKKKIENPEIHPMSELVWTKAKSESG